MSDEAVQRATVTGGRLVVDSLIALGVTRVFGIPGGQTLAITDAILDTDAIEFVTTRHEGAAAVMADQHGRLTGTPGACLATTGPGATNLLTGVGGAMRDSSPVIVLTCNNKLPDVERDDAQNADHVSIFRPLVKWTHFVAEAHTIPRVMGEAGRRAVSGNPGPVLVDFARTAVEGVVDTAEAGRVPTRPAVVGQQRPLADPNVLAEVVEVLAEARRPVLWVGNGVQLADAEQDVLELAERLDAPVITTFNAIGAMPTEHPHVFGPLTRMGTGLAKQTIEDADVLFALGNSMNAISTGRWSITLPETIVQVDIDPETVGRNYPARTLPVVGDVKSTIRQLLATVSTPNRDVVDVRAERLRTLRSAKSAWWSTARSAVARERSPMSPADLVMEVRAAAPDDAILVVDAGNPGVWSYLWEVRRPRSYFKPVGFGNMGFGVPAAIATSMELPQRPVIALVGDGSLGMTVGELETLARECSRVCIVVMNDSAYGNIKQEQLHHFGEGRYIGVDFNLVDYAQVATGFGVRAESADSLDALRDALVKVLASDEPGLIDARIDGDISAWTYPLFNRDAAGA